MRVRYKDRWYEAIQASYDYNSGQWWYNIIDQPDTDPLHTEWVTNAAEEQPKTPTYWSENKELINQKKNIMTQKEFDLRMQELKLQYIKEKNEINRKKDAVNNHKMKSLILCDDEFHAKRRSLVNEIRDLTSERFARAADDPKREELLVRCKMLENEISLLRFDNATLRDKIICQYAEKYRQLDEEHRQLSAWYEEEKLRAMREYIETEKQNPIEEVKVVEK